jgi:hypothetical protein
LAACAAAMNGCSSQSPAGSSESDISARPPQFVLLAFDGSLNLDFWKESREFAKTAAAKGAPLKFTYFMSSVYFIPSARRSEYVAPQNGAGKSAIGFGGENADIAARFAQVNLAIDEGHEPASHGGSHFDGSTWSRENWDSEFDQFNRWMFNENHPGAPQLKVAATDIVGFRAPLLANNHAMYDSLRARAFTYDTSQTASADHWPEKINGIWNFPLAELIIAGTKKRTLSMDYNFYFQQSKGEPDPDNADLYHDQMLATYRAYFKANYNGNRAPVHIGHHFSKWNNGAYWRAMQDFALEVCGQPNVRCTTYGELVKFMESRTPEQLDDYRHAKFTVDDDTGSVVDPGRVGGGEGTHVGDDPAAHEIKPVLAEPCADGCIWSHDCAGKTAHTFTDESGAAFACVKVGGCGNECVPLH